jgi:hypothetical protein
MDLKFCKKPHMGGEGEEPITLRALKESEILKST